MGWGYGIVNGREVGYSVEATCDRDGCGTKINRGLSYVCGSMHGGAEFGCGGYFCESHLLYSGSRNSSGDYEALCEGCSARVEDEMLAAGDLMVDR